MSSNVDSRRGAEDFTSASDCFQMANGEKKWIPHMLVHRLSSHNSFPARFLTYDPKKRITAEEALSHKYFKVSVEQCNARVIKFKFLL